jgi:hypothetical protein|tara:strand:- start:24 stop:1094 length:1071 start_codon:yes stop_codon:yes gene_type:complete
MNNNEISDKRTLKDFKGITFSNYKKSESKKELLNSLIEGKIEPACYWSIEFICAGHFLELWDIILIFYSQHINTSNPKLPLYMEMRFNNFKDIIFNGYVDNELQLRNNPKIRLLFAEMITILCLSTKTHALTLVKVNANNLNITNISDKLKADSVNYGNIFFKREDPKELFIAINEFVYHLRHTKNSRETCYWFEWIIEYEGLCKREKKNRIVCAQRHFMPIENKYKTDIICLIWEILLKECDGMHVNGIIRAIFELFCIKFKPNIKKKRRFLIYSSIVFITNNINLNINIYTEESKILNIKDKINTIYKQIKKNEIKPNTDYLFNNSITQRGNLEKTIEKLEMIGSLNTIIPRNK